MLKDLKGQRFHRLVAIECCGKTRQGNFLWLCQCDCGNSVTVAGSNLLRGNSKSCGCYKKEKHKQTITKAPFFWLFTKLQSSARYTKRPCTLTFSDFLHFTDIKTCHYCCGKIVWYPHRTKSLGNVAGAYYLDRKDSSKGYSVENCVVCCPMCNSIKSNTLTYEEMMLLQSGLVEIQKRHSCLSKVKS